MYLEDLEEEMEEARKNAKHFIDKGKRLAEAVGKLDKEAGDLVAKDDEAGARKILQSKSLVKQALEKALERADANYQLACRLEQVVGREQTQLIKLQAQAGMYDSQEAEAAQREAEEEAEEGKGGEASEGQLTDAKLQERFLDMERKVLEKAFAADSDADTGDEGSAPNQEGGAPSSGEAEGESGDPTPPWWHRGAYAVRSGLLAHLQTDTPPTVPPQEVLRLLLNLRVKGHDATLQNILLLVTACYHAQARGEGGFGGELAPLAFPSDAPGQARQAIFRSAAFLVVPMLRGSVLRWQEFVEGEAVKKATSVPAGILAGTAQAVGLTMAQAEGVVAPIRGDQLRELLMRALSQMKGLGDMEAKRAAVGEAVQHMVQVLQLLPAPPECPCIARVGDRLRPFISPQEQDIILDVLADVSKDPAIATHVRRALGRAA